MPRFGAMLFSVIIVNYNVCHFLEHCLRSVWKALEGMDAEVIVVDNASTDASAALLPKQFPTVQFIWLKENLGFGKANNLAMEKARGQYLLILNPDTLIPETFFKQFLEKQGTHRINGATGFRMIDGSGAFLPESKRGFPDGMTSFFKMSGFIRLFPRHRKIAKYYLGHLSPAEDHVVEILAGACMMIPAVVYQQVGGFDEAFFMYGEDIDLSYRISEAGFSNYYLSEPSLIHFKGESTRKDQQYVRRFYEAMIIFVDKHFRGGSAAWKLLMRGGILLSGSLSAIRNGLKKAPKPIGKENWKLMGDPETIASLMQSEFAIPESPEGKFSFPQPEMVTGHSGPIGKGSVLVLCLGEQFTLRQAMGIMEEHGPANSYRFYYQGAASVIGSDSSDENGRVWLLK
ncbi:glycosyltransferase family 2 protein [Flavihumibacter rivuli]|uniref:glycosyltransferase family 2 protein n=1 Tax=Flavihumibacter rivuli TaxID=2838156 RepID=UPI001BDE1F64|nr:glycosyltransferase family 2 protein [Flavihumibacter rivuli]ULQ55616.1 glycosyltransferase family 2 protein [Flavihumibacter rivuli]